MERGFLQLKLTKTDVRNKLGQSTLNDCLAIKLLSPHISDFDPTKAINHWNESAVRSRRPLFKDGPNAKPATQSQAPDPLAVDEDSDDDFESDTEEVVFDNLLAQ